MRANGAPPVRARGVAARAHRATRSEPHAPHAVCAARQLFGVNSARVRARMGVAYITCSVAQRCSTFACGGTLRSGRTRCRHRCRLRARLTRQHTRLRVQAPAMRAQLLLLSLAVMLPAVVCQTAVTIVVGTTPTGYSPNIVGVNMGARPRVHRAAACSAPVAVHT
jgi:hypothetical protein